MEGLTAAAIFPLFGVLFHFGHNLLASSYKIPPLIKAYIGVVVFSLGLFFATGQTDWVARLGSCMAAAIFLILVLWSIFKGYQDVGIGAAFHSTQSGVGFQKSLRLATTSLDFLGTGASKLTEHTKEFEDAMKRCAVGGRVVRLLLSHPGNPLLETLSLRNERSNMSYSRTVTDSLKRIARLQADHQLAIQLRFYSNPKGKDFQNFRLMFINKSLCLWGWTVFDGERGRNNPQVLLFNQAKDGPERSAYHAFQDYFNRLWDDPSVTIADLSTYIDKPIQ